MTFTTISNATLAQGHISQQRTETDIRQSQTNTPDPGAQKALSEGKIHDNVALSQTEKSTETSKVIDSKTVEASLPETLKSILSQSAAALSAQANTSPETARELLS